MSAPKFVCDECAGHGWVAFMVDGIIQVDVITGALQTVGCGKCSGTGEFPPPYKRGSNAECKHCGWHKGAHCVSTEQECPGFGDKPDANFREYWWKERGTCFEAKYPGAEADG